MRIERTVFNVIARPSEEGGYWAEVIELPGCVSQGKTKQELLNNIIDAIRACVETYEAEETTNGFREPDAELWGIPAILAEPKKIPV